MQISSLEDWIEVVVKKRYKLGDRFEGLPSEEAEYMYRGQSRSHLPLIPKVFRNEYLYEHCEQNIYADFILTNHESVGSTSSVFERLCLMQHYGYPTRLLDWTFNPLVAMYFACSDDFDEDGELFSVSPNLLNMPIGGTLQLGTSAPVVVRACLAKPGSVADIIDYIDSLGELKVHQKRSFIEFFSCGKHPEMRSPICTPVVVQPASLDLRMQVQKSVFTIAGGRVTGNDQTLPIDVRAAVNEGEPLCRTFSIPKEAKANIVRQLQLIGVDESTLFPDIEHRGAHVSRKHAKGKIDS